MKVAKFATRREILHFINASFVYWYFLSYIGLPQLDAVRGAPPPKFFKKKLGRASEACDQAVRIVLRGSK